MKSKLNSFLLIMCIFAAVFLSNCAKPRFDFSLKNTVSVFLLNKAENYFFCIPLQYMGDYKIDSFEYDSGYIQIGDYKLLMDRDEINIYVYLNEAIDIDDFPDSGFDLVYSEENGRILLSKMGEALTKKITSDEKINYYYIFIERYLKNDEIKKITDEYGKGNVYSSLFISYDISIDSELQSGSGMYDDFEISSDPAEDYTVFFPNLGFFRVKYLQ